jgi:hypothetical protein
MSSDRIQKFPRELLSSDAATKKSFFRNHTVGHPVVQELMKDLLEAIDDADSDTVIIVYGPTGVGKTTLRHAVHRSLVARMTEVLQNNPSRLDAISEELKAPIPPAFFNWGDNFHHLLESVGEPLVDRKIDPDNLRGHARRNASASPAALRRSWENILKFRKPLAVLLDEAQVITIAPASRLLDQCNVIKSIASQTGIPHVLLGTYKLLPVRNLDGQVSRRCVDLHFTRYTESEEHCAAFANTLRNLALAIPFEEPPNLDPYIDLFHEKTAGCIGLLKTWLERSYSEALRRNARTIGENHITKHMPSLDKLAKLFNEIAEGEAEFCKEEGYDAALRKVFPKREDKKQLDQDATTTSDDSEAKQKVPRTKPGQMSPQREKIGPSEDCVAEGHQQVG